ncbi:LUD domain-containing protein [Dysgonomonas sp. Marseille-P4361]|uniref:LutC/YkgG family protein n=1 Tax=Dysgonomonas sp. Marseille-P4361 TaxID=2161820 RepID=UPI000D560B10|nr:LUD domain-containing protein [Dysgonomonas sp. Marseille-P4361]
MSNKNSILENTANHIQEKYEMPDIDLKGIQYNDKISQFIEVSRTVGGEAIELKQGQSINDVIKEKYPEATSIASNLAEIEIATLNPDLIEDAKQLNGIELGIVKGEIGVAENGCVWIPQNTINRALYFISEFLVIILDKDKLVNNMHEAYAKLEFSDKGYGVFISGPSKTADIEQALVVGAHGARGVTVILT